MVFSPPRLENRPPASSITIFNAAKSQGFADGSIQTSAFPCATNMASIEPPRPRTAQNFLTQGRSLSANGSTPTLLKPLKERTDSAGSALAET